MQYHEVCLLLERELDLAPHECDEATEIGYRTKSLSVMLQGMGMLSFDLML